MRYIANKLLMVLLPIFLVIYLFYDFEKKSEEISKNYTTMLSDIYQFNIHFSEHLSIIKESIINLSFSNDNFTNHCIINKKVQENSVLGSIELDKSYPSLEINYKQYNEDVKKLMEDTYEFVRINAQIKNSLTILNKNIEKNLKDYDLEYLKNLILITKELNEIKNNLNSDYGVSKEQLEYFKSHENESVIHKFNSIHIELLNKRLTKFKKVFRDIQNSDLEDTINEMKISLEKDTKKLEKNLDIRLYIIIFITVLSLFVIVVLLNNIHNINKNLERTVKIRTKQFMRERNKAQRNAKSKSEFLANMSHEIRTPLNAILGFIDILKTETSGKSLEYVYIIDNASKSLLQIIQDILDFSKIESGKLDIEKIDFDSKMEFDVISHLFDAKCKEKNISLKVEIDKAMPPVINTDPYRLKQVISNLLSNAIKFTPNDKEVYLNIVYRDNFLDISVKDQGIGIAKDKLEHIFEPFSQEDSSTTRRFGGTGLGLSISKELIRLLGGELKVKSEVGLGSEFYFSIPVSIGKKVLKDFEQDSFGDISGIKILLVEDNKANQMFMKVLFKKLKVEFDIANDGLEAIESFKTNSYDVILMDENMPNMNGIEATSHILAIEKDELKKHTPIVALTANALKGDRERFLNAGFDEYLTKPLDKNKLTEVILKLR